MTEIPVSAEDLTPQWLTALLVEHGRDDRITDVRITPVGTGQMAGSFRLDLKYAKPTDLPRSMVAKLAIGNADQRAFASGAFRNEVRFYRDLVAGFEVPTPRCFASTMSESGSEFVLLLEDMAAARQGDQISGCTPAQVESVAVAAAGLHGPRWNDPGLLEQFPLPTADDRILMDSVLEPMAELYRERFRPGPLESATVDWLVDRAGDWLTTPITDVALIHGDLRVDNVLFGPDDAVTVIDWQTTTSGHPLRDIAFLLSTSLTVDDRRAHEHGIVETYHRALLSYGVSDYTWQQCWQDYVDNLIQAPLIVVFGSGAAQPTERGDAMFATMLSRSATAIDDLIPDALTRTT